MRHLNPFFVLDKKVCPELVLAVRLLAVYLLVTREGAFMGNQGGGRFLPILDFLGQLGPDIVYNRTVLFISWAGMAILLFSYYVRTGAFLTGFAIVTGTISCQTCISVAHLFTACVFLCTALSNLVTGNQLLRYQLVVLYTGANLNKLVDPDWWNGAAIETLLVTKHQIPVYMQVSGLLPPMLLSTFLGISVMVLQFLVPVLLLRKSTFKYACLAAFFLHVPMVILMQMTFGPFLMALTIAYSALLHWPRQLGFNPSRHSPFIVTMLTFFDSNGQIQNVKQPGLALKPASWPRTIIHFLPHPAVLFALTCLAALLVRYGRVTPLCVVLSVIFIIKVWLKPNPKPSVKHAVSV